MIASTDLAKFGQFFGRDPELHALLAGLKQANARRGSLFLIGGEPGIGKSRLSDEFARQARELGAAVLWGRCWEGAGAPAYWPWIQALRAHIRSTDPAAVRDQLGAGAADVAQMLPEVGKIVPDLPSPPPESDSARFQLFDSTTSFLRNICREQPTILVLDDLQSADTPSILLLRFLASQLADMRLVAVATYRDVELTSDHPLTPALHEMAREPITRLITLGGLPAPEVARFVQASTGRGPHAQLVARLWQETNGNPLFVGEAVRLLASEGRLDEEAAWERLRVTLPAGVREVILKRVRQLAERTMTTLVQAAAIGPEFSAELLRRAGDHSRGSLTDALSEATQSGLLMRTGVGRFRFSHDLVRDALYAELEPTQRLGLHLRIAETLEQMHAAASDARFAELAHHYFEAAQAGFADEAPADRTSLFARARRYARLAGEQAARSLAYEEAARLFSRSLQLLDLEETPDTDERTDLLLALGDAQARAGDLHSARPNFLEAAGLARQTGDPQHLARAALGYGGRFLWARAGDDPHVIPLLQEALVLLGGRDDGLRVRLLSRLACAWRGSRQHFDQSDALSQQAVEIARQLGDRRTLCYALVGRYGSIYWPHTTAERLEIARELLSVAETAGDIERTIDAHMITSFSYADLARMSQADAEMETLTRLADQLRQPAQLWLANAAGASYALLEGRYSEAERLMAVESPPGYPTTPIRDDVSAARMHRFLLRREQGRLAEELETIRRSVAEFPWYPAHRAALLVALLELGRENEARSSFATIAHDSFATLIRDNEWLLGAALSSEACAMLADAEAAGPLLEQLRPFAGLHAIAHAEGSAGIVDRYLGLLAITLGRIDEAAKYLADAITLNDRMGAHPWRAHSQHDLASLLRRRGRPADMRRAEELERDALQTAEKLEMTALAARLAPSANGRHLPVAASLDQTASGTFRREGDYWKVSFENDTFQLRDAKGLRYLAHLLAEPGREFLALELVQQGGRASRPAVPDADLRRSDLGDAGAQLDIEAKQAYRARLHELQGEMDEAEAWNDAERADRARQEMEFLARELARAVGLGGRDRAAGSVSERARLSVTRAIRLAMARIDSHSPALGAHLEASIRTGTYCSYRPDPRLPVSWQQ